MYPFVSHTSLPWTMGDSSVFRIRKSSDWLTQNTVAGVVGTGGLNFGSVVNASQWVVIYFMRISAHILAQGVYWASGCTPGFASREIP